jgi:hypothetical protein
MLVQVYHKGDDPMLIQQTQPYKIELTVDEITYCITQNNLIGGFNIMKQEFDSITITPNVSNVINIK